MNAQIFGHASVWKECSAWKDSYILPTVSQNFNNDLFCSPIHIYLGVSYIILKGTYLRVGRPNGTVRLQTCPH